MKKLLTSSRWLIPVIVVTLFSGCSKDALIASAELTDNNAASSNAFAGQATAEGGFVDGAYIVVFNDDISDVDGEVNNIARSQGIKANYTYKHVIKGFVAKLPAAALNALKNKSACPPHRTGPVCETGGYAITCHLGP